MTPSGSAPAVRTCSADGNSACAFNGTYPASINCWGVITGTYYDADSVGHGFVSYPPYTKSTFTSFGAPATCSSDSNQACSPLVTFPEAINLEGLITLFYVDRSGSRHAFVARQ